MALGDLYAVAELAGRAVGAGGSEDTGRVGQERAARPAQRLPGEGLGRAVRVAQALGRRRRGAPGLVGELDRTDAQPASPLL
jgi:hypothetical protein